ncbi:MAG: decaprenylphospho-beta-D-erythro-pentofuranosid-2-ulose 2-reductase [Bacteroidia bacterium]|jgi:decaprenylphospho-beta-D-erythro-pentofuranosid-2-ulose 2-reductase
MQYLILGATSDVAISFAEQCPTGSKVILCARNSSRLDSVAKHLKITKEITAEIIEFDLLDNSGPGDMLEAAKESDVVLVAWGILESSNTEKGKARLEIIDANFRNQIPIIEEIADQFEKRGSGVIAGMSSVAGLRGRASNYLYGSAKAGMIAYLSGLRNRLTPSGVHVVTIIPGFMRTKMTAELNLPGPLTAEPKVAARIIHKAIQKKKNVAYVTPIWWLIMLIIRNIPEFIFKKLKL